MVLSIGLNYPEKFAYALALLVVYSLGLGAVLVSIGILLVSCKSLLLKKSRKREMIMSYLPMLSALFISGLGAYFLVSNYFSFRPEISGMLQDLAEWIGKS